MSGSSSTMGRSWKIRLAVVLSLAMTTSVMSTVLGVELAGAEGAPVNPATPRTTTADSLPTVQINGVAWDQVIVGNTVYVTGQFTSARPAGAAAGTNETARSNLLAYNLTTGNLITTWAPTINAQGRSIVASEDGTRIYVVGDFVTANGTTRNRVAAFNATTGALITTFNPNANFRVNDIAVSGNTAYIVGAFTAVGNQVRTRMAAVDATSGALRPWAPTADLEVRTVVAPAGSAKIIVGGHFNVLNGAANKGMGALDAVTGAVLPWPVNQILVNFGPDAAVWSLATNGTSVFGVGYTYLVNNRPDISNGNFEGTFSADVATGNLNWVTGCRGDHYDVGLAGDAVYDVSHTHECAANGGNPQTEPWTFQYAYAWSVDAATATSPYGATNNGGYFGGRPQPELLHWEPTLQAGTYTGKSQAGWTVEGNGQYVVMGGEFPRVNNVAQYGLARFAVTEIAPDVQGPQGNTEMTPTTVGSSTGTLRVSWKAAWDRDNNQLTYEVLRGASANSATVIKTVTASSHWWARPKLSFADTTAAAGSTQTYRIRAKDAFNNTVTSAAVTGTVPGGLGTDSQYRTAVNADSPTAYWRLGEATAGIGYDQVGADDLTIETAAQRGDAGALLNESAEAATSFPGNGSVPASTTGSATTGPQNFSAEAWFKTTTTNGGKILGFGRSSTGNSGSYDRHLYMQNDGAVRFGVYDGGTRTILSKAGLNDGQWHHAVGEMGPAGLKLYVDGKLAGSDPTATVAENYPGFWRIGGDNINGWPGQPNSSSFAGSIDEVAIYSGQLSTDQVRSHWLASGRAVNWPIPPTAPADSYGAAVWANNPSLFLRLDETSGTDARDRTTNLTGANYFDGVTLGQAGSPAASATTSVSLDSGAARVVSTTPTNNPRVFTEEVWFKTDTTNGGRIIGFGNSQNGQSNNYDRAAYMLNSGQIRYGVWTGQESTVVSPQSYNDGAWHHLVITQNVGDQKMYVDGQLVVEGSFPAPQDYTGYWRLGSDSMWGGANTQDFRGQLDEAAIYPTALAPGDVLAHWTAAGGSLPNVAPAAAFTSSSNDLAESFNGSTSSDSDGTISDYSWDFGDGTFGTGVTTSRTYLAAGTYNVTLTVTDDDGATNTVTNQVSVTGSPANVAPAAAFTSSTTNLTVDATSTSTDSDGTIVSTAWDFGDSTSTVTTGSVSHAYAAPGTYALSLTVTDDDGATNTVTRQVTVTAAPLPNVAPTAAFTSSVTDLTASFDGSTSSDSDGTIVSRSWTFGDTTTGTGNSPSHTYSASGTYTVTLTVTDDDGATNTATNTVTVVAPNVAPTAAFTSSSNFLAASFNGSTSSDSDGTISSYAWDFGDGTFGTGVSASRTYAAAGTYTVTLMVTDDDGATHTVTNAVTVADAPPPNLAPTAAFTFATSNLVAIFNATTSSDSDGTVSSYAWNFGDGATGTGVTTSRNYAAAGTYTVTLAVTDDDGAIDTLLQTVTVTAPPVVTTFANDTFSRTLATGFGTANTGGAWTLTGGNASYSIGGGVGRISVAAGASRTASLNSVQQTSADITTNVSLDKPQTGGGTWLAVIGRRVNASNDYRLKLKIAANGTVTAQINRTVTALETVIQTTTVPGLTYAPGDVLNTRFQVSGNGTTILKAKVWKAGTSEPIAWILQGSDTSAVLQAPGSIGIWAYLSGSATQVPRVASFDDFAAGPVA